MIKWYLNFLSSLFPTLCLSYKNDVQYMFFFFKFLFALYTLLFCWHLYGTQNTTYKPISPIQQLKGALLFLFLILLFVCILFCSAKMSMAKQTSPKNIFLWYKTCCQNLLGTIKTLVDFWFLVIFWNSVLVNMWRINLCFKNFSYSLNMFCFCNGAVIH